MNLDNTIKVLNKIQMDHLRETVNCAHCNEKMTRIEYDMGHWATHWLGSKSKGKSKKRNTK